MKDNLFETYMNKVIDSLDDYKLDDSFLSLNDMLKNSEVKGLLNRESYSDEIYRFLNDRLSFINKYKHGYAFEGIEQDDIEKGAKALLTVEYFIGKGIDNGDLKEIIKGLFIFTYFQIDFNQLIELENFNWNSRERLSAELKKILSSLSIKINLGSNVPYNEKKFYQEYETGIKEKNLKKVYELVEAVKRGIGYSLRGVMRSLIMFAYFIDPIIIVESISKKTDPLESLIILEPLANDEKIMVALEERVEKEWIFVGVIYEILDGHQGKRLEDEILDGMGKVLGRLYCINEEMFFQCINYFRHYEDFNIIIGRVLAKLDKTASEKYVNGYEISRYRHNRPNDRWFIENFIRESEEENVIFLCSEMFKKWTRYLKDLVKQGEYINEPIYTNCFYMVIYYFLLRKESQEEFYCDLERALFDIEEVNYVWYEDELEIRGNFFLGLTYLLLLSIEYGHKSYKTDINGELISKLKIFLKDKRRWIYYFNDLEKPHLIEEIEKNFQIV